LDQLIGIFNFFLLGRFTMVVGWYELLMGHIPLSFRRRRNRNDEMEDFVMMGGPTKRNLDKPLASDSQEMHSFEDDEHENGLESTGILPEPTSGDGSVHQRPSVVEAGDTMTRHETTNWFEDTETEGEEYMGGYGKGKGKEVEMEGMGNAI
jgi:hypothetical protein